MSERAGLPILSFPDRATFEAWLAAQHAGCIGLWLKLAKKDAPAPTLAKTDAIDAALCHGWIDGQIDKFDEHYWLVRFTPRKARSNWSKNNRTRAAELIAAGEMRPSGIHHVEAAKADGRWDAAYSSARAAEIPPDLSAALSANAKAAAFFAGLTGANRYAILYRIETARKVETRARKIADFVAMLERGETIHC